MKPIRTLIPVALLSVALLAGCGSQAQAPDAGEAAVETEEQAPDAAEQDEEAEPAPEPAMSNWYDKTFYERPVAEIASDLELLGFEVSSEAYDDTTPETTFYTVTFKGTPEGNPLEGTGDTVAASLSIYQPAFKDDAAGQTLDDLAEDTMPTGYNVSFFYPETPDSEYEGLAQNAAETLGFGEITDSSLGDPFENGRIIGNYFGTGTYQGVDAEWLIFVSTYDAENVPDADFPTIVDVGYWK